MKRNADYAASQALPEYPNIALDAEALLDDVPLVSSLFSGCQCVSFDMVIFDEASQIFPQDAIGQYSE